MAAVVIFMRQIILKGSIFQENTFLNSYTLRELKSTQSKVVKIEGIQIQKYIWRSIALSQ